MYTTEKQRCRRRLLLRLRLLVWNKIKKQTGAFQILRLRHHPKARLDTACGLFWSRPFAAGRALPLRRSRHGCKDATKQRLGRFVDKSRKKSCGRSKTQRYCINVNRGVTILYVVGIIKVFSDGTPLPGETVGRQNDREAKECASAKFGGSRRRNGRIDPRKGRFWVSQRDRTNEWCGKVGRPQL